MDPSPNLPDTEAGAIPVVAIGASAGGLEEIRLLLEAMPSDTGAAFVVLQHLDPEHDSHLTELIAESSDVPAVTIEDGMPLEADRIHVLPAGYHLGIHDDGRLQLTASTAPEARPSLIDRFFDELAAACDHRAVAIVLSGCGSDGTRGLKAIRQAGGLAMVQEPDDAEFDGMPRAAATHVSPDCLRRTTDLAAVLVKHLRLGVEPGEETGEADGDSADDDSDDQDLATAREILREHGQHDFRHHKPGMLKRRLRWRTALAKVADVPAYLDKLRDDNDEREHLRGDFLIGVTGFFREPESFAKLEQAVIRTLLEGRSVDNPVRVWVPGCATGEEAYSIAMLLAEAVEASGQEHKFQVFASDIDEKALVRCRVGMYPAAIADDVSAARLESFFDPVDGGYRVKRQLRERVVFAPHSVTDDPPYSRLDLISCRNLLIYLTKETQQRLVTLFHFALKDTGFLFLGGSETVGKQDDLFQPLSKNVPLYRRLVTRRRYRVDFSGAPDANGDSADRHERRPRDSSSRRQSPEDIARTILLSEHVPASVLVNRKLEILCSFGPTGDFLSLPLGESTLGLLEMAHEAYRSHLRAVIHRAVRHGKASDITTTIPGGDDETLLISARPLQQPEAARGLVLVTFERLPRAASVRPSAMSDSELERQLAEELEATRTELHGTIDALEESNEELKGSNEEVMSMNEELQATNEELATSKEELQSVNEELSTVNTELETKVDELETAHNDLSNLFAGTQVATLFLDRDLRIKRFTPSISELLSLIDSDIGRPLADMTLKFTDPRLLGDARKVIDDLLPREAEVRADDGRWFQRSVIPYRTREDVIDGAVISFTDITELKRSTLTALGHEARLDLAVGALAGGMWEMHLDAEAPDELPDNIYLSPRLKRVLGFDDDQLPGSLQAWSERIVARDRPAFLNFAQRRQRNTSQPLHYRIRHRDGSLRWFASYGKVITDVRARPTRWVGIDCDISTYKAVELRARQLQSRLQQLGDALPEMVVLLDHDQTIRFSNAAFNDCFQAEPGDLDGRALASVLGEAAVGTLAPRMRAAQQGKASSCPVVLAGGGNDDRSYQASHVPCLVDGKAQGMFLLLSDTSARRQPAMEDGEDQTQLAYMQRMATVGELAATLAHDLKQPLGAINNYAGALTRMLHAGKPADDTVPVVSKIADQVERTGGIVDSVRDFVGRQGQRRQALDLNEVMDRTVSLMASRARHRDVDMRVSQHTPLPAVRGDAVQLQQILVNLVTNALDAMRDNEPDRERTLRLTTESPNPEHVQVMVRDSGPGIPAAKLESIFDSFQSTKLGGMGMGLAISRVVAHSHGGQLWAESEPGHGATFYLRLPVEGSDPL